VIKNQLIELYDIVSKDIVLMDDSIKRSKVECEYNDIISFCAGKIYAHKVLQDINKLLKIDSEVNSLVKKIENELQYLEKKIQWLQEGGDQVGSIYLEGKEEAYKQLLDIIKGEDNE